MESPNDEANPSFEAKVLTSDTGGRKTTYVAPSDILKPVPSSNVTSFNQLRAMKAIDFEQAQGLVCAATLVRA